MSMLSGRSLAVAILRLLLTSEQGSGPSSPVKACPLLPEEHCLPGYTPGMRSDIPALPLWCSVVTPCDGIYVSQTRRAARLRYKPIGARWAMPGARINL